MSSWAWPRSVEIDIAHEGGGDDAHGFSGRLRTASPVGRGMTRTPIRQHGTVLAGVKALRPFGRPAAGLDPGCERCNQQGSGAGPTTNHDHIPTNLMSARFQELECSSSSLVEMVRPGSGLVVAAAGLEAAVQDADKAVG